MTLGAGEARRTSTSGRTTRVVLLAHPSTSQSSADIDEARRMKLPTNALRRRNRVAVVAVVAGVLKFTAAAVGAGVIWVHVCGSYTPGVGSTGGKLGLARSASNSSGILAEYQCPAGDKVNGMEVLARGANVRAGARA